MVCAIVSCQAHGAPPPARGGHGPLATELVAGQAAGAGSRARVDNGLPFVSERAAPPDLSIGASDHVARGELPVLRRVPLPGEPGEAGGERVRRRDPLVRAERTTVARHDLLDRRFPCMAEGAAPPRATIGPDSDVVRGEISVLGGVPPRGGAWHLGGQRVGHRDGVAGAERTADGSRPAARHALLPFVVGPLRALPPDVAARAHRHVARREHPVLHGVPLPREVRAERRKRSVGRDAAARAERAPVRRSTAPAGRPFMPARASPPEDPAGPRGHVLGQELSVPGRVPLVGRRGRDDREVVRFRRPLPGAEGATFPVALIHDPRLPRVVGARRALPPDGAVGRRHHVARPEVAVLGRVPSPRGRGLKRGQGIGDGYPAVHAEGADQACPRPVVDGPLPLVVRPRGAPPPELPVRAGSDALGREGAVLLRIELCDELGEVCEGSHREPSIRLGRPRGERRKLSPITIGSIRWSASAASSHP